MSLSHSQLRTLYHVSGDPDDVLVVGTSVKRTHFNEGPLTVAAVNRRHGIVVLRREGRSEYISRMTGSIYAPAAHMVCRFWTVPMKDSNRQETWCECLCEAPIKKDAKIGR